MVVAYHAVDQWTTHIHGFQPGDYWPNGSAGVDIFFVISGLVMTLSARRKATKATAAWTFIKDRIIRIIPLYWIITTCKIVVVLALPALISRTTLEPSYVAASYALLPVHDATGVIRPVLPVGWTLSYEMFFYIAVAIALMMRQPISSICIPVLLVFSGLGLIWPADGFPNTIAAEFILGIAIGGAVPRLQTLPTTLSLITGVIALCLLVTVPIGGAILRPLSWGLPAAVVVAAAVSIEMPIRQHLPKWLLLAGNASYATYLTHGFVIPTIFLLCARSLPLDWVGFAATVILGLVVSAAAGQLTYRFIEQPLLLRLRTRRPMSTLPASG